MTLLLVFVIAMHAFIAHGFAGSLVYCFESNGDVNIESTTGFSFGFIKECDSYSYKSHDHGNNPVIHSSTECEKDIDVIDTCLKDNNTTRNTLDKVDLPLLSSTYLAFEYPLIEQAKQPFSSQQPYFDDDISKSLRTIRLLI